VFVENRIRTKIQYAALADAVGFSLSHLRTVFMNHTGKSLVQYITERKMSWAAFDIIHSSDNIFTIAERYGFSNPDTFTRAFKRVVGLNPSAFRKIRPPLKHVKLCAGVFGFAVQKYVI